MKRHPPNDAGSTPAEFVLVAAVLTALTLGVLQLGLALYVRNVVHDAAMEGAHVAALADADLADGADRTREIISRSVGSGYAELVTASASMIGSTEAVEVTVVTTLPLAGLLGLPRALEVSARAPAETLER